MGVGGALYVASLDWTISNIDQWSPSHPELGHESEPGKAMTYSAVVLMPYLDVCCVAKAGKFSGRAGVGIGPVAVEDEDDHLLRKKRSTGEMKGVGVKTEVELRYEFTGSLFALVNVSALSIEAHGTQTQEGYGGELEGYSAEIDEEFSMSVVNTGVAAGYRF